MRSALLNVMVSAATKAGRDAKPRVLVVDPWTCALSPAPAKGGT